MIVRKTTSPVFSTNQQGSKWQELANLVSRKARKISILKDEQTDPALKKTHEKINDLFIKKNKKK
ncbi:MAG: hypothetical protein WC688_05860 [Parachlamydiales bacterium]|jgi:hypothetical protein